MCKNCIKQKCPKCKGTLLMLYGCGWDYDRLLCGNRLCLFEKEFKTSTLIKKEQ